MTPQYLRILFFFAFLVAVIAIFTAWSEIGGQSALDIMPWGWKSGLGLGLAFGVAAYGMALLSGDTIWNARTIRWLALMLVLAVAMGVVTYYYVLQVDSETPEDQDNPAISHRGGRPPAPRPKLLKRTTV